LTRLTPNFFAIPFGLAGLAGVWRLMSLDYGTPGGIADALSVAAAVVWLLIIAGSLARMVRSPHSVLAELRDPVFSPFWSLTFIIGMLLAGELGAHAPGPAKDLFVAFFIATVLMGGWLTGEWIAGELDQSKLHPGYLLPTVAGGLLGAEGAAQFGLRGVGWMSFGIGMLCWLLLGSLILNRLLLVKPLAPLLQPTLAIELAPPAVAGSAYFLLHGSVPTAFAYALAGYTVLMVLVQLRLLPLYVRLKFNPGFWSFTFSWSAVAAIALRWLAVEAPGGQTLYASLVAGAISLLVAAVAARSLLAGARGELLPPSAAAPDVTVRAPREE
jgi:tellurite resistance protein